MSYDIYLRDPVHSGVMQLEAKHHMKGGTYALGGTTDAHLNVTYNYAEHYGGFGEKGVREIYGMTGAESIPLLKKVAGDLGDDVSEDYWEPTEGNAKQALLQLLALAQMLPHGVWGGD